MFDLSPKPPSPNSSSSRRPPTEGDAPPNSLDLGPVGRGRPFFLHITPETAMDSPPQTFRRSSAARPRLYVVSISPMDASMVTTGSSATSTTLPVVASMSGSPGRPAARARRANGLTPLRASMVISSISSPPISISRRCATHSKRRGAFSVSRDRSHLRERFRRQRLVDHPRRPDGFGRWANRSRARWRNAISSHVD